MMSMENDYDEYKNALNDLKMNSKPVINFLTYLAEEKVANAYQVVRAIEDRILEVGSFVNAVHMYFSRSSRARAMLFYLFSMFSIP
jgi:hypothetical protein